MRGRRSLEVSKDNIDRVKSRVVRMGFPSQVALANQLGLSRSTISNFLNGRPVDRLNFEEIALAMGFSVKELIGEKSTDAPVDYLRKNFIGKWNSWVENFSNDKHAIQDISLDKTILKGVRFINVNLEASDFNNSNLDNAFFSGSILKGIDLHNASLCGSSFENSSLSHIDLHHANLRGATWSKVEIRKSDLHGIDFAASILTDVVFDRVDLSNVSFKGAKLVKVLFKDCDLEFSNFNNSFVLNSDINNSNLNEACFIQADFSNSSMNSCSLKEADLSNANLTFSQFLDVLLLEADLTGACIQDWQINSTTNLDGVRCEYIYRKWNRDTREFTHRLPYDPNSTFAPGEFTNLFQVLESALDTINLTFSEGIDWQAFFASFQDLRNQHPDKTLAIQGMERKGDAFVVRLEVGEEVDKGAIETEIKQFYQAELQRLEAQYEERLRLQGKHLKDVQSSLEIERQRGTGLMRIVEANVIQQSNQIQDTFNARVGSVFNQGNISSAAGEVDGDQLEEVEDLNQQQPDGSCSME